MKFLCDVHISLKTVKFLTSKGYESVHINTVLDKWFTKDTIIAKYVDDNDFILVTKDTDFRDSFFLKNSPKKLVKINLGNISNLELIKIIDANLDKIEQLNTNKSFIIEIDSNSITFSLLKITI